ncbi:MAG: hypothetical protein WC683_03130 [bacterium]
MRARRPFGIFNNVPEPLRGLGEEDKGDESGCESLILAGKTKEYEQCEESYWGSSAGDCHQFQKRMREGGEINDDWCRSKGGTDPEPCVELAHSCISTVVCQVFNYMYGGGAFTKQCGQYGEPVGDVIWYLSGFQFASGLLGPISEAIKCIGANSGSCWTNIETLYSQYAKGVGKLLADITKLWDTQRAEAGLPWSAVCIDAPFLSIAAMIARGDVPATLNAPSRAKLLSALKASQGYAPKGWAVTEGYAPKGFTMACVKDGGCECPPKTFGLEEAFVELSLWTDPNGFQKTISTNRLVFLNKSSWVQAFSRGIASSVQLVDPEIAKTLKPVSVMSLTRKFIAGPVGLSGEDMSGYSPPMLPEGSKPLKLFLTYDLFKLNYENSSDNCAFNLYIDQKGGPEACKSIAASNDSRVCAGVAQELLSQRLEALRRVLPLVIGAMTAHNAHYAMRWQQSKGTIPFPAQGAPAKKMLSVRALKLDLVPAAPKAKVSIAPKNRFSIVQPLKPGVDLPGRAGSVTRWVLIAAIAALVGVGIWAGTKKRRAAPNRRRRIRRY